MATVANPNAQVRAGNGIGPATRIYAVATGTITMEAAVAELSLTATVTGIEGTADGDHVAVQGGVERSGGDAIAGVTLVASFNDEAQNGGV